MPPGVDHLIYGAPDLETGMEHVERLLGVRPVPGGRHPDYGTRNALLSLGPATYLEVMAPDPELPAPAGGRLFGLEASEEPRLVTWVLRAEAIERRAREAAAAGVELGPVSKGARERPDGTVLSWRLTDPRALPLEGAVPFLIAWGGSPHPARDAPSAGPLVHLRIEHPRPWRLRGALAALGVRMEVARALRFRLRAVVETSAGRVELT